MTSPDSYRLAIRPEGWRKVEPTPDPQALKAFYAEAYFQQSHGNYAPQYSDEDLAHRKLLAELLLFALRKARGGAGGTAAKFLEIGCGEGFLLSAADAAGYQVKGLDFSDDGVRRFHPQYLDRVMFGDAFELLDELIDRGEQADACAMEHVLEHVADPEGLLRRLPRLLGPGGVAAITAPNDFSPVQDRAMQLGQIDRTFWVCPPQHLNYFGPQSLLRLIEQMGFEVLGAYSSFPIDWFLFHEATNYVADPKVGKSVHKARRTIDLLLAEAGIERYHTFCEALFGCGVGRSLTVLARPRAA